MKKIITLSGVLLILDIVIKLLVSNLINLNSSIVLINNFLSLTYVRNIGAAWSILEGKQILLIIISMLFLVVFIFYIGRRECYTKLEIISYSMIISGTLGNMIDRIIYGYVIDYIDILILGYNFPIFNLADTCIVIGIMLLLILKR